MSDMTDALVVESPPTRKHRLPLWLRWVVGIPLVMCAIVLIALPPQQAASLSGWTPGCPQLESAPWREISTGSETVGAKGASGPLTFFAGWIAGEEELIAASMVYQGINSWLALARVGDEGTVHTSVIPAVDGSHCYGMDAGVVRGWLAGDRVWLPVASVDPVNPINETWWMVALDRETLEAVDRVSLPLVPERPGFGISLVRAPGPDTAPWILITKYASPTGVKKADGDVTIFTFNPATQVCSTPVILPLPQPSMPGSKRRAFSLWTEEGAYPLWARTDFAWHIHEWVDPTVIPGLLASASVERPDPALAETSAHRPSVDPAWREGTMRVAAEGSVAADIVVKLESYELERLADVVWPSAQLPSGATHASKSVRKQLAEDRKSRARALRPLGSAGRMLRATYPAGTSRWKETWLLTSWNQTPIPLAPEFRQSLLATLDHLTWDPISLLVEFPSLELYVIDKDSLLVVQVVVTRTGAGPDFPNGLVRIGRLAPPNNDVEWLGFVALPQGFPKYSYSQSMAVYADTDAWRIGISGVDTADPKSPLKQWSTTIAYPEGFSMPYTGWMSEQLPPALQPWGEPAEGAIPGVAPLLEPKYGDVELDG